MRLNKYMRDTGLCSRREADDWIREGRVSVDGVRAVPGQQIGEDAVVRLDGQRVKAADPKVVLAYHKPAGLVCTTDPRESHSLFRTFSYPIRVTYAGRLDKDSEGLLLLTNDGDLIEHMMRARYGHEKEYEVTVDHPVTPDFLKQLSAGVRIRDEEKGLDQVTRPCPVKQIGERTFSITLTQGINRQIRRMCQALQYQVVRLKRVRILNIRLGDLAPGAYREITGDELEALYERAEKGENGRTGDAPESGE